jgi:hypothetical protein
MRLITCEKRWTDWYQQSTAVMKTSDVAVEETAVMKTSDVDEEFVVPAKVLSTRQRRC